jgi:micrococcal nuclease
MQRSLLVFLAVAGLAAGPAVCAEKKLTTAEAGQHVGENATVSGVVASGRYAERTRGRPTFLNLKAYPEQVFTILIWGENRAKFGTPEQSLLHKRACVSGSIREYGGKPEIIASEPSQIERQE